MLRARRQRRYRAGCLALALALGATLAACTPEVPSSTVPSSTVPSSTVPSSPVPSRPVPSSPAAASPSPAATPGPGPTDAPTAGATAAPPPTAAPPSNPTSAPPTSPPTANRQPVDVVVTYATWNAGTGAVEVGAYVAGVVEDGGECTLRLTRGTQVAQAQGTAVPDASTTGCGLLPVSGSSLSSGTWTATVGYTSPVSAGQSAPVEVQVP